MSGTVKPRRYDSPLRELRAQETRTAILDAGERLFAERGYVRTTLPLVATEAGVSLATVKLVFGTKTEVLLNVWHRTLAGGLDDRVPAAQRDWYKAQFEIADPAERIRLSATNGLMIKQRIAALAAVIDAGAAVDDSLAELQQRMYNEHHAHVRQFIERLDKDGHLRADLTVDEGTDVMWMLNHTSTYRLLVHDRSWPAERYLAWLIRSTQNELLPPEYRTT